MATAPLAAQREEVPLRGFLAEFRTALRAEIDAASRHASSAAVPLVNGRRIAQVGGWFQYAFDIENPLNLPGDTPGDLHVPNRAPLAVSVISTEGSSITLSISEDMGSFVPTARLQSNLTFLMRRLIERIEALAGTANPVGERVRGAPVSGRPVKVDRLQLDGWSPNREQQEAVASSLGRDTTFIWGAPGTGKTATIGAIGVELYLRGRSVLLVSHTNIAVDQAVLKIGEHLAPDQLAGGRVLRVGDPYDRRLNDWDDLRLDTHVNRRSVKLASHRDSLAAEREAVATQTVQVSRRIEICEWVAEARQDLAKMTQDLAEIRALEADLERARAEESRLSASSVQWAAAARAARAAQERLAVESRFVKRIAEVKQRLSMSRDELCKTATGLAAAEAIYSETTSANWLIRRWRRLPPPEEQLQVVEGLQARLKRVSLLQARVHSALERAEAKRAELAAALDAFRQEYSGEPVQVLRQAEAHAAEVTEVRSRAADLTRRCGDRRQKLDELLRTRLTLLRELALTSKCSGSTEAMLSAISSAHGRAAARVEGVDVDALRAQRTRLNGRIRALDADIQRTEEALKRVEEVVIADATIVATTLTRAYLRDTIRARRFDTVILDEASMAPIPALWVAASLADANAVVVGDFRQLPPIVISKHELAKKWLGRDIFKEAGLRDPESAPPHFVILKSQYRMHPSISAIPNELIYKGRLRNGEGTESDKGLKDWYRNEWGHDYPVLLVDTGSVGAWVTSVPRGARYSSRLNWLSATICVDLAEQLLRNGRKELSVGDHPRILIVCPYRPHAKLLQLLVREQGLAGEVLAGTAHSFQGSEADVVIFDLVNDEPHWRVGMFMPQNDESMRCLLNVALTRARRRLIVVGDFDYVVKRARKAFVGKKLIPFLRKHYHCVDALDIVPAGLAARAAEAQMSVFGGEVEPDAARLVVTQKHFYSFLRGDLARASSQVVIYSPFIAQDRLSEMEPQLRAAVERGVQVYVVTKVLEERGTRELSTYRRLQRALIDWGVTIVPKRNMHEKLVFIDDDILWSGSLNPLSFRNTQEVMERRVSRKVSDDFAKTIRLDELLHEYRAGQPLCPICGFEIVATEGRHVPYYWLCTNPQCSYTRDIDQPTLEGGIIRCFNCGGSVEHGEWGGKPAWRCIENRHHHQKVARTHLLLPKMRVLVPTSELRKLDRRFGISPSIPRPMSAPRQGGLFDSEG